MSFLDRACSDSDFMVGVLNSIIEEVGDFVNDHKVIEGTAVAAVVAVSGVAGLVSLAVPLLAILAFLAALVAGLVASTVKSRLGSTLNELKDGLLGSSDPGEQAAGIFVWQCIGFKLFSSQQGDLDFEAISYAVLDGHNYTDKSCQINVDSIEVFFDARDPMLLAFVDALTVFENRQEFRGKAFAGYASLRFTGATGGLIGEERAAMNCVVEVAGLLDVTGTKDLVDFAIASALNPNYMGILHWGQRNESTVADIEARFGDTPANPGGNLGAWRDALSSVTDNGRLDGFSSAFTRQVGLEVVTPRIHSLIADGAPATVNDVVTVRWDAQANPPSTELRLDIVSPASVSTGFAALPLSGHQDFTASEVGDYKISLTAVVPLNGEARQVNETITARVLPVTPH